MSFPNESLSDYEAKKKKNAIFEFNATPESTAEWIDN